MDGRPFVDPAGFSRLYERQHLAVFRYLYGKLGGPREEVEDLSAETFLRAWRARRSFAGPPEAGLSWLLRIARNLAVDAARRQQVRPQNLESPAAAELALDPPASQPGPEDQLLHQQQQAQLVGRLAELPELQQELVVLRYLLDWPVKEIAAHLGLQENTASVYLRRGLERLRRDWTDES